VPHKGAVRVVAVVCLLERSAAEISRI